METVAVHRGGRFHCRGVSFATAPDHNAGMAEHPPFPPSAPMHYALREAAAAAARGEVPVGAVITASDGTILAAAGNRILADRDPSAHAEMLAIRAACQRLGSERLTECDLHVTLEPCAMCAGLISFARIRRLYFGAFDRKGGAVEHGARFFTLPTCHHAPEVYGGIGETEAAALLTGFFQQRRGSRRT